MNCMLERIFFYPILGTDFYHTAFSYFIYGSACWLMECIFESIRQKKFVYDRGFNKGPICTIYGVAFLFIYFVLKPLDGKWLWLFLIGIVYTTTLEYVTAILLEKFFHQRLWDYSDMPFNFQGRIQLFISLAWGALVVLFFAFIHPLVTRMIDLLPKDAGLWICIALIILYFTDLGFSFRRRGREAKMKAETIE